LPPAARGLPDVHHRQERPRGLARPRRAARPDRRRRWVVGRSFVQAAVHKGVGLLVATAMLSRDACVKEVGEWHNTTVFDPAKVEEAIARYYLVYNLSDTRYGRLTPANKAEIARAIGEKVAILNPTQYNDVLGHLAADYRHHPENREAIESILNAV